MAASELQKRIIPFVIVIGTVSFLLLSIPSFVEPTLTSYVEPVLTSYFKSFFGSTEKQMGDTAVILFENLLRIFKIILWMTLIISIIRLFNYLIFGAALRNTNTYELSGLIRSTISITIYIVAFFIVFQAFYPDVPLAPIFTGSTILGVVIGLAMQDTLGNLFAGIALQADQSFQVGDVINVPNKGFGVVENVSWRGVKIRTFQNKLLVMSNSVLGKEAIEVAPRENLNARIVFFNTLYANSPAKTIQLVREIVRQVENVSPVIRPIVRIRNLGDNGIDWEVKYWIEDYAKYNDTDALVRQRIWYAFQREKIEFAYPTRTIHVENKPQEDVFVETDNAILERLNSISIFSPLSDEEIELIAAASLVRVFAPDEKIVRKGQKGHSMFVIHRGSVNIQIKENGKPKNIKTLNEGEFFGEMGLFTGEPRTATVVAEEETEVLEINHFCLKPILENNLPLVESFSQLIDERRTLLTEKQAEDQTAQKSDAVGVFESIRKFFGL
ncbi:MAG: mechanosensitive ion channel family protein [Acidobacteria bacterium]|nr:mechanosensitive ion channel family protein [Acidobacteriota bacterium]